MVMLIVLRNQSTQGKPLTYNRLVWSRDDVIQMYVHLFIKWALNIINLCVSCWRMLQINVYVNDE